MNRLLCLAGLLAGAGCGLIDSDVADVDLSLPERTVTVDTADWELADSEEVPAVDCAGMEEICGEAMAEVCAADDVCSGACGGDTCEINVAVALWQRFHLAVDKPELDSIDDQPLVSVTIDRIYYSIPENTFNVTSPPLTVYVAPDSVMSPSDPQAEEIGTIAPVPAMTMPEGDLELTPDGQNILSERMKDYQTPFNLIVGADVLIQAGDPVPTGRLVAVVKVDAHAGL
jgi:hypothetical protein